MVTPLKFLIKGREISNFGKWTPYFNLLQSPSSICGFYEKTIPDFIADPLILRK